MSETTIQILILILVLLALFAVVIFASNYLMRRAVKSVIKIFRDNGALTPETAKTTEYLGFKKKSLFSLGLLRDYKPYALQLLLKNNIVQETAESRLFLSERDLSQTNMKV